MFSPIECRLRPSRLARVLIYAPVGLLTTLGGFSGVSLHWLLPVATVTTLTLWRLRLDREHWRYLRWHGTRLTLFAGPSQCAGEAFEWGGRGRRNAWYVRLQLQGESGRLDLLVWRDSVSDASWRALNACFRVQSAAMDH